MSEPNPPMNQAFKVAIVVLALLGIFATGAVVGLVVTAHFSNRRFENYERERKEELRQQEQKAAEAARREQEEQQKLVQMVAQLRQQVQRQSQQRMPPAQAQFGPQLMQRFINQIKPTPEQREALRPLVYQAAEELRRLRRDTAHSTELILEQLQDRISALLTPEQRDRFEVMIQRSREAFKRYNLEQQRRQEQQRHQEQQHRPEQQPMPPPAPATAP